MKPRLSKPKSQLAEVLYELLRGPITRMSIMRDTGILNLTARIAELRLDYFIKIDCERVKTLNKHKRKINYGKWTIDKEYLDLARGLYTTSINI